VDAFDISFSISGAISSSLFLEPQDVPGIPTDYDAGINRGLGVPAGFYHFAFEAGSAAALAEKRDELRAKGVETTDIVDHGWAQSIYFKDPNGLSLEYCCMVRNLTKDDATMQESFTIARGALELTDTLTKGRPDTRRQRPDPPTGSREPPLGPAGGGDRSRDRRAVGGWSFGQIL
jgi:hypothetical protein